MKPEWSPTPERLVAMAREVFPGRPEAVALVRSFWSHRRAYLGRFARSLLDMAGGRRGDAWEVRCLAALMLGHQVACLPAGDVAEHRKVLRRLGLLASPTALRMADGVLAEGYSTTRLVPFLAEFRRRLARRGALSRALRKARPPTWAWEEFLGLAREECAIDLARYLFTPAEVVDRVRTALRITTGDEGPPASRTAARAADELLARWPVFEREIAGRLAAAPAVYWTSETTGARPNALIAQPPGTVVVVVKPPGSALELEIKRAGRRARLPLGAVFERGGKPVPPTHHLDGGSLTRSLRFEAEAAARFGMIFRAVWGRPAPIPVTLSTRFIAHVPASDRSVDLLEYFSDERVFGTRFPPMRAGLRRAVEAYEREADFGLPRIEGDLGLTVRFVHYTAPGQSVLAGTTMYRVDRLAHLLGEAGAGASPVEAAGVDPGRAGARRLAMALMEQILAVADPPPTAVRGFRAVVDGAFARPSNRRRADRAFRSLMRQFGVFWGTLLAARGYSNGESLVARNVGIAPAWERGRWRIRLIFMDHDDLNLPDRDAANFRPDRVLRGVSSDEKFGPGRHGLPKYPWSLVDYLRLTYRVGPEASADGEVAFRRALARSYRRTSRALQASPDLSRYYSPSFRRESEAWDRMAEVYLARPRTGPDQGRWRDDARSLAARSGLEAWSLAIFLESFEKFAPLLERMRARLLEGHSKPSREVGRP
jgi:hypothetical protein